MSSASDRAAPEASAFQELAQLVHHLGDELAAFRRRALQAEARVKAYEAAQSVSPADLERMGGLEQENVALQVRLEKAAARTRLLLEQIRFLRQQRVAESDQ